jgi:digeranylgeranylglycerophospholipid reductase
VLLLEKDSKPGTPVRCGEAVNRKKLEEFVSPDSKWISATINKFSFNAPDSTEVVLGFDEEGFILNRSIFDYELALAAVNSGTDLAVNAYVYDLLIHDDKVCGVKVRLEGEEKEIRSKIVVAADGVESRIGRFAGLRTYTDFREMESCVQVSASGVNNIKSDTCYFYFGDLYSPGGYVWVFPKGKRDANIGLGVNGSAGKKKSADKYLNDFINDKYNSVQINRKVAGGVPCTPTLKKISAPGIMLAGDAARQVNPLSGGGISSGMTAGSIAGRKAAESILCGDMSYLTSYQKEWHERIGKRHEIYNRIKNDINGFDEKKLNNIAHSFSQVPPDKRTLGKLFTTALLNNPMLLVDVAKVFVV